MPVHVAKRGGKYCVVDPDGKLTGKCYSDRQSAVKQVQAINMSMRRREGKPTPPMPKSKSGVQMLAEGHVREVLGPVKAQTKDKKSTRKLDPNAKVRNRGNVVFSSTHPKVKDNKDHFPINDADQARNALARVAQYGAAPAWWAGSLKQLQSAVRSAVRRKYKNINVTEANCRYGFDLYYANGKFHWARGY